MQARVLRQFMNGEVLVQEGDDIEIGERRGLELEQRQLIVITNGRNVRRRLAEAPDWWPRWQGETVAIVGSGPSAAQAGVEKLRGLARVVAVNRSWELVPWADALFASDFNFWERHGGVLGFRCLKIGNGEQLDHRPAWDVRRVTVHEHQDRLLMSEFGELGLGGNSGFAALNFVAQAGAERIILVGFDMRIDLGVHWHGRHGKGMKNPMSENVRRWRRVLDAAAPALEAMGITVINASPVSALRAYRKASLGDALL